MRTAFNFFQSIELNSKNSFKFIFRTIKIHEPIDIQFFVSYRKPIFLHFLLNKKGENKAKFI